jgi:hypothetical protein
MDYPSHLFAIVACYPFTSLILSFLISSNLTLPMAKDRICIANGHVNNNARNPLPIEQLLIMQAHNFWRPWCKCNMPIKRYHPQKKEHYQEKGKTLLERLWTNGLRSNTTPQESCKMDIGSTSNNF